MIPWSVQKFLPRKSGRPPLPAGGLFALLGITLFLTSTHLYAQTPQVRLIPPPPNQLNMAQLWKAVVTHTGRDPLNVVMEGTLEEARRGRLATGETRPFLLAPGTRTFGYQDFQELGGTVHFQDRTLEQALLRTGNAPSGLYTICVALRRMDGTLLAQDCLQHEVRILSPPRLMLPANGDTLPHTTGMTFVWQPVIPQDPGISYTLKIVEILPGQSPEEAMDRNPPRFSQQSLQGASFTFPANVRPLAPGRYAWQVEAKRSGTVIAKSEIFSFWLGPSSPPPPLASQRVSRPGCSDSMQYLIDSDTLFIAATHSQELVVLKALPGGAGVFRAGGGTVSAALTPSNFLWDTLTGFSSIHVQMCEEDDILVVDEGITLSYGVTAFGNEGNDLLVGSVNLGGADSLIQQIALVMARAESLRAQALDSLFNLEGVLTSTAENLGECAESALDACTAYFEAVVDSVILPTTETVRSTRNRLEAYLNFLQSDVYPVGLEAESLAGWVDTFQMDLDVLLPQVESLLAAGSSLVQIASVLGCDTVRRRPGPVGPGPSGPGSTLRRTGNSEPTGITPRPIKRPVREVRSRPRSWPGQSYTPESASAFSNQVMGCVEQFLGQMNQAVQVVLTTQCPDTTDPVENTDGDCLRLEALADSLENHLDSLYDDEVPGSAGNVLTNTGDSLGDAGDGLAGGIGAFGDDEDPQSHGSLFLAQMNQFDLTGEHLGQSMDSLRQDWESWGASQESTLTAMASSLPDSVFQSGEGCFDLSAVEGFQTSLDDLLNEFELFLGEFSAVWGGEGSATCTGSIQHRLLGNAGVDVIVGSPVEDSISGEEETDFVIGGGCDDILGGGDGHDFLFGGAGNDSLRGGERADVLVGNGGDDVLAGGSGEAIQSGNVSLVVGDLFLGNTGNDILMSGNSRSDTVSGVDLAFGGRGEDVLVVGRGGILQVGSLRFELGNVGFGEGDADSIFTGEGVDVLFGGEGNDYVEAGKGSDFAIVNQQNDTTFFLSLGNLVFGHEGNDRILTDEGVDVVFGNSGDDTVDAQAGGTLRVGTSFRFVLGNVIFGSSGADHITTTKGMDFVFAGEGDDQVDVGDGDSLAILDQNGNVSFVLEIGNLVFGSGGDDRILAGKGMDVVFTGEGDDVADAAHGGLFALDTTFSLKIGNILFGSQGDDSLLAQDGVDVIFGGQGADYIRSGMGDTVVVDSAFSLEFGNILFGSEGDDVVHADEESATGRRNGVDLVFAGQGNDRVYGGEGGMLDVPDAVCFVFGNIVFGSTGDDFVRGDFMNPDTSHPAAGLDLFFGGKGADTLEGNGGSLITIGNVTSGSGVLIWFGNILFGNQDGDRIRGGDGAGLCGNSTVNNLLASVGVQDMGGAADLIFAGDGGDHVEALNGVDLVFGSAEEDTLHADHGGIVVIPIQGVPVPIAMGNLIFGGDGADRIRSKGRLLAPTLPPMELDLLFGNTCNDHIEAGNGINLVFGNQGNDSLIAGDGINILFGNRGNDVLQTTNAPQAMPPGVPPVTLAFGNRGDDRIVADDDLLEIYVLFGNKGEDHITGGTHGITLAWGNSGEDVLESPSGGVGISVLFGNKGADRVAGGGGLTVAFGNRESDEVMGGPGVGLLFGNRDADRIQCGAGFCLGFGNKGPDLLSSGPGVSLLFGNQDDDRIHTGTGFALPFGNSGNDVITTTGGLAFGFGNTGDDILAGEGGMNFFFGNRGSDDLRGGNGVDFLIGNRDGDALEGMGGTDFLFGNRGEDTLKGGGANDFLFGNRDNDVLEGGGGDRDLVFGNRGNDHVYSGNDGQYRDYLFGNRDDDTLDRCPKQDRAFGGAGSDTKTTDCLDAAYGPPMNEMIIGKVLEDVDGDGDGDIGVVGATVSLSTGTSVLTDSSGWYAFGGSLQGIFTVQLSLPPGTQAVSPLSVTVPVAAYATQTAEFVIRRMPTVCVAKFHDLNGNGIRDAGESLLYGWAMKILNQGTVVASGSTGEGAFCAQVAPGTYTVQEVLQPGWIPTRSDSANIQVLPDGTVLDLSTACPTEVDTVFIGNATESDTTGFLIPRDTLWFARTSCQPTREVR